MSYKTLNKSEQKEIQEVLAMFGLKEKEREVYLALLELNRAAVTPLAKYIKFPVTTVQSVLGRLVEIGIVGVTLIKTKQVYEANDPSVLKKILERKMQEISGVIPLLKKIKTDEDVSPKIKVFFRERMTDIFHEALNCKSKLVYEIVSAKDIQNILGEKFHFTKRRKLAGVYLKSLRIEKNEIKKYNKSIHEKELREAKFLPRELTFRSSIMFWDDTVAFFTNEDEGLAWTVDSRVTRETWQQLFELLWGVSRKMETLIEE